MFAGCRLVDVIVAIFFFTPLATNSRPTESSLQLLSDHCLRCLCAASSDCRPDARCRVIEPDTYLCGPFRLNEAYWSAAGSFTPKDSKLWRNNPLAFELCALDLQCSIKSVLHYTHAYLDRCSLLHADMGTKCMLAAFVHYRAIYLGPDEDQATPELYYDDELEAEQPIAPLSCHLNSSNLSDELAGLLHMAPAARSDDNYWRRFDECSQDTVIDCGLSLGPVARRKASPRFTQWPRGNLFVLPGDSVCKQTSQIRLLSTISPDFSNKHGVPSSSASQFILTTLGQLLENATRETPDKTLFIVQYIVSVDQLAKDLQAISCLRRDPVDIWAVNSCEWLLVQFASAKLGCIFITVNSGYKERELAGCINLVGLKTLICNQHFRISNYCQVLHNVSSNLLANANGSRLHSKE